MGSHHEGVGVGLCHRSLQKWIKCLNWSCRILRVGRRDEAAWRVSGTENMPGVLHGCSRECVAGGGSRQVSKARRGPCWQDFMCCPKGFEPVEPQREW